MRKFNTLIKSLLSTILILGLSVPVFASADTKPIEQFYDQGPSVKNVGGYTGVLVEDSFLLTTRQSNLIGFYFENKDGRWVQKEAKTCTTYSDPNCSNADNIWYDAILGACKSASDTNCVVGVTAIKDGKEIPGKYSQNYPETNEYAFLGDAALNIPDGGLPSLWTFDGISHQGGDQFMVFPRYFHNGNVFFGNKPSVAPQQFDMGIFAISKSKVANAQKFNIVVDKTRTWWNGSNYGCQSNGSVDGECALSWPLPKNVKYRLEIRTSIPITSFMHGRLLDPTIKIETDASGRQLFTVEAGPVSVPVLNTWVKNTDMPKALYDYLYAMKNWGGFFTYQDGVGNTRDNVQLLQTFDQYTAETFKEYLWWLDVAKDKSIGDKSLWIAHTLSSSEVASAGEEIRKCLGDAKNLTGIVTTNAGMYVSSPPTFNKAEQSLDYRVSSPHFNEVGKENVGNYNLVINSESARCIYGFTKAPISATVSIISSDGTAQVATTTVNEKNGWVYLSANGFNYSAPTVRVKLTQEAAKPEAVATPTPTAKPAAAKKTTITCVKGKTSKKVTAVKPVCPTGYKKK
jgi:hypothetical protein